MSVRERADGEAVRGKPGGNDAHLVRNLGLALVLIAGIGCESQSEGPEAAQRKFVPDSQKAQEALETILSAWRDAPDPMPKSFDTASVKFVDSQRHPAQRLRSYEILGETELENARQFTVRLTLDPAGKKPGDLVRYNVFGIDPLWVFRKENYDMISHWEHEMPAASVKVSSLKENQVKAQREHPRGSTDEHRSKGTDLKKRE